MSKNDLKFYENLVEKELNALSNKSIDDQEEGDGEGKLALPKKKRLKKELSMTKVACCDNLELVVAIYRLLIFNFKKYSVKWNYSKLMNFMQFEESSSNSDKTATTTGDDKAGLIKFFCLKICSLLLNMTPGQEESLFNKQFTDEKLENVYLK